MVGGCGEFVGDVVDEEEGPDGGATLGFAVVEALGTLEDSVVGTIAVLVVVRWGAAVVVVVVVVVGRTTTEIG